MKFSKEQRSAIEHIDGPMMVVAGPGSGKTTVITHRIKYLIESAGVSPADILVITFTKAAALEMETRFKSLTKGKNYPVRFGTFHSIFFWIIKTAYNLSSNNIMTENDKRILIEKLIRDINAECDNKDDLIDSVISQISLVKCDMLDIDSYYSKNMPENDFRIIYKRFEQELSRQRKIDFDNMMVMCYDLLVKRKDILDKCRQLFKYILVDEFQDSNKLQYEIFKMLAIPRNNAFIVGDDDQSVYGFRGARPEIMNQFLRDFSKTKKVMLCMNYRCDQAITLASSRVISRNTNRFEKELTANSSECGLVQIIKIKNEIEENNSIVELIRKKYKEGVPYEKQAVLYRTNIQPRRLLYRLNQFGIPYTIGDMIPNIFEHFAVKNVLDYMRIAMGDNSRATFLRVLNRPSRYISRESLMEDPIDYDKLRWRLREKDYAVENLDKFMADMKLISKMRPYPALNFIRKAVGYNDYIKEYSEYRMLDCEEIMDILDEFASMITEINSYAELFEFIDSYSIFIENQYRHMKEKKGVNLMTMHSSKGLEFDVVYIMDGIEGIVPYKKAKTKQEIEEERRMFYVAMTRALHELNIFVPEAKGSLKKQMSRFVVDAIRE